MNCVTQNPTCGRCKQTAKRLKKRRGMPWFCNRCGIRFEVITEEEYERDMKEIYGE